MSCFALMDNECLAMTKCNTTLRELVTSKNLAVIGGELLKITRLASFGDCLVKIYSCERKLLIISDEIYACDYSVLKILNEPFALMLVSIPDRAKRLMICSSTETENFLTRLKLNDVVNVNKAVLHRDEDAVCIIKYIGPVKEIGPGTYVGCILFDEHDSINDKNNLSRQYFNCNSRSGFIRNCGCFFTRKFLLDQDTTKLLALAKTSRPPPIVNESQYAKQKNKSASRPPIEAHKLPISLPTIPAKKDTNNTIRLMSPEPRNSETYMLTGISKNLQPSAPPYMPDQTNQPFNHSAVIIQQNTIKPLYPSPVPQEIPNRPASYPRQQYITDTNSPPKELPYKNAVYPRQKYITEAITPPRENLSMCSTSSTDRYLGLSPGASQTLTIRRSIREGPKKTAKRIIYEEKVIHTYSGDKKKKKCVIL